MSQNFTFAQGPLARRPRPGAGKAAFSGNALDTIPEIPRTVGRPSRLIDVGPTIAAWLRSEPGLKGVELFRRARAAGYLGGKSALYDFVRRLRSSGGVVRRGPAADPGVYAVLEFTTADVRFAAEGRKRIIVLVAELTWSGFVHVGVAFRYTPAARMRCVLDALAAFGGVPLAMGWASPRLVARVDAQGAIAWEPALTRLALQVGCALQLHDRRGRAVPAPRHVARRIKDAVFTAREFEDRADLDLRLRKWLSEVNRARDPRKGPPAVERLREEGPRLLPFPEERAREFTES